jgi:phage-related protein
VWAGERKFRLTHHPNLVRIDIYIVFSIFTPMKRLSFFGHSRNDYMDFPAAIRNKAGFQLDRVQRGLDPEDWKPMSSIGLGVKEVRLKDVTGAYRVIYVATFVEAVFVLHAFQKKSQRTSKRDIDLAAQRFKDLANSLRTGSLKK